MKCHDFIFISFHQLQYIFGLHQTRCTTDLLRFFPQGHGTFPYEEQGSLQHGVRDEFRRKEPSRLPWPLRCVAQVCETQVFVRGVVDVTKPIDDVDGDPSIGYVCG